MIGERNPLGPFVGVLPIEVISGDFQEDFRTLGPGGAEFKGFAPNVHMGRYRKQLSVLWESRDPRGDLVIRRAGRDFKVLVNAHDGIDLMAYLRLVDKGQTDFR